MVNKYYVLQYKHPCLEIEEIDRETLLERLNPRPFEPGYEMWNIEWVKDPAELYDHPLVVDHKMLIIKGVPIIPKEIKATYIDSVEID
jgi:hypothetical protein